MSHPIPPRRTTDDAQGWADYDQKMEEYFNNTILGQFNVLLTGRDANGNAVGKPDPAAAIMYFILVLGPAMAARKGDNIDESSFKLDDLKDVATRINRLKELFNEAKDCTDPAEQKRLTDEFKSLMGEVETKLNNDPWLEKLKDQFAGPLNDFKQCLGRVNTLTDIWKNAGYKLNWEFSWLMEPNNQSFNPQLSFETDPNTGFQNGIIDIPEEVWEAIQGENDANNPQLALLRRYCVFSYDSTTHKLKISINQTEWNKLTPEKKAELSSILNREINTEFNQDITQKVADYNSLNQLGELSCYVPEDVAEKYMRSYDHELLDVEYDRATHKLTIRPNIKGIFALENRDPHNRISDIVANFPNSFDSIKNELNKFVDEHNLEQDVNEDPDASDQKTIFSGLDTMASVSTSLSNQFMAQQNIDSGSFNELINAIKDFMKEFEKSTSDIVGKTR